MPTNPQYQDPLFDAPAPDIELAPGALVMRAYALGEAQTILQAAYDVARAAPFRRMQTARGWQMSVAVTNCGQVGWVSDRSGYRYDPIDPESGKPWPAMPEQLEAFARRAAGDA